MRRGRRCVRNLSIFSRANEQAKPEMTRMTETNGA